MKNVKSTLKAIDDKTRSNRWIRKTRTFLPRAKRERDLKKSAEGIAGVGIPADAQKRWIR